MTLWPIVTRELRVKARTGRLRRGRVLMAAVALLVVFWMILLPEWSGACLPPQVALTACFSLAFWVAWFAGAALTTDSFSREYREGTLRLLFLSHLRGGEIALGKLVSNTLTAAGILLAAVPMLCLPVMLGAAPPAVVFRLAVSLLNALIFSAALGLLFSSSTHSGRRAHGFATLLLIFLLLGTPFFARLSSLPVWGGWFQPLLWLSPVWTHTVAWGNGSGVGWGPGGVSPLGPDFWPAVVTQQGAALLMALLAGAVAARRSVERPAGKLRRGWRERWRLWQLGAPATRAARRRRLLDRNPFTWLICRYRFRPLWPLVLVGAPLAGLLGMHLLFPWEMELSSALLFAAILMHALVRFHMAAESVSPLLTERLSGTLPLLLSTPLRNRDFMQGQWQAMRRQFGPALGLTLLVTLALVYVIPEPRGAAFAWLLALLACAWLLMDFRALTWVGMWCATWRKKPRRAAGNAGFLILALPWLIVMTGAFFWSFLVAFLFSGMPSLVPPGWKDYLPLLIWIVIVGSNHLFWTVLSRRILRFRLRQWVSRPLPKEDE